MACHVLLVDDDVELVDLLRDYLSREGFEVTVAHDGGAGVAAALRTSPDILVLDAMMPTVDGFDALRMLRARSHLPVLMLTARGDDDDRILGLELGADDYVAKPCTPRELLARIRAILRRVGRLSPQPQQDLSVGPFVVSPARRRVTAGDIDLGLTSTEFSILEQLARRPGQLVTKAELSLKALGRPYNRYDRSVDMHVSRIRQKLGEVLGGERDCIRTVVSRGYQWVLD